MQDSSADNIYRNQGKSQTFDQETVEAFASLFKGRTDCWGKISTPTGKCIYETVTLEHYRRHLKGEVSLGVYFNLDNHTCHLAAIDIDDFSFDKAKAARAALRKIGIPAYIASSKSNRFHVYLFAEDHFISKEIRRILIHTRDELRIKTSKGGPLEVFPKQDYHQADSPPSEKYPNGKKYPGSYINLPCFGYTRPFLAVDDNGAPQEVPLEVALEQIKRTPNEVIKEILKTIPEESAKQETKRPKQEYKEQSTEFNELAIEKLLENCTFMRHCEDEADSLSEPHWWSMCDILSFFGEPGRQKAHELSQPHPKYTKEETDQKLEYAKEAVDKSIGPHTCQFIEQDLGFSCPESCQAKILGVKSPAGLAARLARTAGLPTIIVTNKFLREKTTDTIAAVEQANRPPQIFERSGHLVRIGYDELGVPYIEVVTESACRGFLERAASYVRVNAEGEIVPLPAPPLDIVRDFMSLPNRNLPALLGITEVPVLRGDGTIITEPGYDEVSHLYYRPAPGLMIPAVSDNPSQTDLQKAVALIQEPILDFPFDSEASRTNALALMITPVCRPVITGPVPLCLLDKPQAGTGAGLLADVIAIIATGRPAAMMAPPKNDEECEKRLTSILRHGRAIITIDNMDGYLYFPSLSMILTATTVQTRILGQSEELLLPNRATYIVTGNNVRLAGDLPRRCYLSRMDARVARPWMRNPKNFKYEHLITWVKENRGELLGAILTMARAWIAAGKPIPDGLPTLGGFEDWTNIVGGILAHAGFGGFLGNLDFMYSQSDVETAQWEAFLGTWHDIIGEEPVTSAELIAHIKENSDLRATLPDIIGDTEVKNYSVKVGQNLGKRNGMQYPAGLELKKAGTSHRAITWKVVKLTNSTSPLFSYKSEVSEVINTQAHKAFENNNKKEDEEDRNTYKSGAIPTSLTSPLAIKQGEVDPWSGMPDYPIEPCHTCGGSDFWPDFKGKRFVCGRCHPKPREIDMQV